MPPRSGTVITLATEHFLDRSADGGRTSKSTYPDTGGAPCNYLADPSHTTGRAESGTQPGNWLWKTSNTRGTWHKVTF